ncbi:hypothetical protein HWV62_3528, partial [Athelia sp. TMB]
RSRTVSAEPACRRNRTPSPLPLRNRMSPAPSSRESSEDGEDMEEIQFPTLLNRIEPEVPVVKEYGLSDTDVELHGRWFNFEVETKDQCRQLYKAAERDDYALRYLDYLNVTHQHAIERSAGITYLLAKWGKFIKRHRVRRDSARARFDLRTRPPNTRHRRKAGRLRRDAESAAASKSSLATTNTTTLGPTSPTHTRVPSTDVVMTESFTDEDAPMITNLGNEPTPGTSVPTAQSWEVAVSKLSASGKQWSTSLPEDWPAGVRLNVGGEARRVTNSTRRTRTIPWDPDVTTWDALQALAPAVGLDGDTARRDEFVRAAATAFAMEGVMAALRSRIPSPPGTRPMEPWPFLTNSVTPTQVCLWFADHGIDVDSTLALSLHNYSRELVPTYGVELLSIPDVKSYLLREDAETHALPAGFCYPDLAPAQHRSWITASEQYVLGLREPLPPPSLPPLVTTTTKSDRRDNSPVASSPSPIEVDWSIDDAEDV